MVLAFLEEDDREPFLGELAPHDAAARAGADDDDVALELPALPLARGVHLREPARLLERLDDIELAAHLAVDLAAIEVHELVEQRDEGERRFEDRIALPADEKLFLLGGVERVKGLSRVRDGRHVDRAERGLYRREDRRVELAQDFERALERRLVGRGDLRRARDDGLGERQARAILTRVERFHGARRNRGHHHYSPK